MSKTLYVYGMKCRPAGPGAQPKDGLYFVEDSLSDKYYSVLFYERELTEKETNDYELEFVNTFCE